MVFRTANISVMLSLATILAGLAPQSAAIAQPTQQLPEELTEGVLPDSIWYDPESDSLIPVTVDPRVDDSLNRTSRWLPKAKRLVAPTTNNQSGGGAGTGSTGLFGSGLTFGNMFGWMLLLGIIIGGVAALVYAFSKAEVELGNSATARAGVNMTPDEQTLERMKHLPAELRRTDVNLRSEAERLMQEGMFDQAVILLLAHQLLLLDRAGLLRLNRGKTNGKYVRETRLVDADVARQLRATVSTFERSYFGRHQISQADFSQLWQSNLQLEESIQIRQEVAA